MKLLASLLLLALAAPALAAPPLPSARAAFAPSARLVAPGYVEIGFHVTPGYDLYRARVHAKVLTRGTVTGSLALPAGTLVNDKYAGPIRILAGRVSGRLAYSLAPGVAPPAVIDVAIDFQGCHAMSPQVCYPPATAVFRLPVVRADTAPAAAWP